MFAGDVSVWEGGVEMGKEKREIVADAGLVACCGLYCGACRAYLKGRCPGCRENLKATWCKVRSCCREKQYASCADCTEFPDPDDCRLFNNFISRVFAFFFNSNRQACILKIREIGPESYAEVMCQGRKQSLPRGG